MAKFDLNNGSVGGNTFDSTSAQNIKVTLSYPATAAAAARKTFVFSLFCRPAIQPIGLPSVWSEHRLGCHLASAPGRGFTILEMLVWRRRCSCCCLRSS